MDESESTPTEWDPTPILDERLLQGRQGKKKRYNFSLLILNQPIHNVPLFLDLWNRGEYNSAYGPSFFLSLFLVLFNFWVCYCRHESETSTTGKKRKKGKPC